MQKETELKEVKEKLEEHEKVVGDLDSGDSGGIHMQMEAAGALLLDANTTTAKCCCPNTMRMPGKILALHRIPRLFLLFHLNVLEDNIPR